MKNRIYKKFIFFGISILFLISGIFPVIGVNNRIEENLLDDNLNEKKCNNKDTYKLLILTPKKFEEELNPLINHKERLGISTKLVTLDDLYNSEKSKLGRDDQEKIKYYIKSAIEEWEIKYVLLIGGKKGQLPIWLFPVRYVSMGNSWEPHIISDLYYADIYDESGINFSSWDSDGDGEYGEWYYGEEPEDKYIDLNPDIAIGRLPCRNKIEVNIVVEKIIEYETNAYGKSWFKDMIAIAGDTYPEFQNPAWKGYEGEYYADLAIENMTGFNPIKLYTSDGTFSGKSDVLNAINNGCGFLYFVGHGNPMTWSNHPPNNKTFLDGLSVQDMYKLKNKDMYPICVVSGCHNNQFDVSILKILDKLAVYRGEATFECWGWIMTRKIDGGSIATLGCTALGYTKEDKSTFKGGINELEVSFFRNYGHNNIEVLGDTWSAAISWYLNTYPIDWDTTEENKIRDLWVDTQVPQSWILFGDPSLKIGGYS